jgi:hypothetical protein
MYLRQNLAFVSSTYPWVWGSFITWWIDRLFVEFGHRATAAPLCNHSNIQYVTLHCILTIVAVLCQTIYSIHVRFKQFSREKTLLGIDTSPCIFHIAFLQCCICTVWAVVIACLADVSPWLCSEYVLAKRASIATGALLGIVVLMYSEQYLYEYSLNRAVRQNTFDI